MDSHRIVVHGSSQSLRHPKKKLVKEANATNCRVAVMFGVDVD